MDGTWTPQLDDSSRTQCGFQLWNVSAVVPDYVGKASVKVGLDLSSLGIKIGAVVQLEAHLSVALRGPAWNVTGNPWYNVSWDFTPYIAQIPNSYFANSVFIMDQNRDASNYASQVWASAARALGVVISLAARVSVIAEVNLFILQAAVPKSYIGSFSPSVSCSLRVSYLHESGEWVEEVRQVTPSALAVLPGSPPSSDFSEWEDSE